MWIAILITVVASTGNNIGKALQKSATANLPRLTLDSVVLRRYLSSKEWVTGLAADLGGGLLMIAAVARAPVGFQSNLAAECCSCCLFTESVCAALVQSQSSLRLVCSHITTKPDGFAGFHCSTSLWLRSGSAGSVLTLLFESKSTQVSLQCFWQLPFVHTLTIAINGSGEVAHSRMGSCHCIYNWNHRAGSNSRR